MEPNKRLIQLLGMMGSTHDGEALTAARMAQRLLTQLGLTWEEAMGAGLSEEQAKYACELAFRDGYEKGRAAGVAEGNRAVQAYQAARAARTWTMVARELLNDHDDELNEWETEFCEGFIDRGWASPTPKQRAVFERIANKCGVECPA